MAFGVVDAHITSMTQPPHIARRKPSEQSRRYADQYRREVAAHASSLSSIRYPVQRKRTEAKLKRARDQAAFYDAETKKAEEAGE